MGHCDGARNKEVHRCLFISRIETLSHTTFGSELATTQ